MSIIYDICFWFYNFNYKSYLFKKLDKLLVIENVFIKFFFEFILENIVIVKYIISLEKFKYCRYVIK